MSQRLCQSHDMKLVARRLSIVWLIKKIVCRPMHTSFMLHQPLYLPLNSPQLLSDGEQSV